MARILVIGGTSGIGYGMACRIASMMTSSRIDICGRTKPTSIPYDNIVFQRLEATSMRQIKGYTDKLKASLGDKQKLGMLIMSQGIMSTAGRTDTSEGIDRKMALHYYGKQLLVRELTPALEDDALIIVIYDGKFGNPKNLNWTDLDLKNHYSLGNAANHCMVMNDAMIQYFAREQRRDGEVKRTQHFVHAWPGGVDTSLLRGAPGFIQPALKLLGKLALVSPDSCAQYLLDGASEAAKSRAEKQVYWSNIDNKGRIISNKYVWDENQLNVVAQHTWQLIETALGTSCEPLI